MFLKWNIITPGKVAVWNFWEKLKRDWQHLSYILTFDKWHATQNVTNGYALHCWKSHHNEQFLYVREILWVLPNHKLLKVSWSAQQLCCVVLCCVVLCSAASDGEWWEVVKTPPPTYVTLCHTCHLLPLYWKWSSCFE